MQGIRRILLLLAVLLSVGGVNAQKKVVAAVVEVKDTTRLFQGFSLNTDLIGMLQLATSDHGHREAGVRVNLYDKYFPAFEMGVGSADHVDEFNDAVTFKTKAPYYRIGCDYNILKDKHDIYRLYAGGRYCFTSMKFDQNENTDLDGSCHWLEAVFGADAQIWRNLHLGWDIRYKRRIVQTKPDGSSMWYVPGLGKNSNAQLWGRFLIMIEF